MPKNERRLKYQDMPAGSVLRSTTRGTSGDHGNLSGKGDDDHPQYLLLTTLFPSVRVGNSGNQTIANGGNGDVITFDTERWDHTAANFHSTIANTSRLTVPPGYDGTYLITAHAQFEADNVGQRIYSIIKNGVVAPIAQVQHTNATAVNRMALCVTTLDQLDDDDYVEFRCYQNSGAGLDIRAIATWSPEFMMIRLGPK